jgi:cell wall-associated NlpC family hydrolase
VTGGAPRGEPVEHRTRGFPISSRNRQAPALLLTIAALVAALGSLAGSATANPSIDSKRAEAQAILQRVQELGAEVDRATNAYTSATDGLQRINADLALNTSHLKVARKSLTIAQARVASRLRALYMHGTGGGAVEIVLGAQNLDDLLSRIDAARRVSRQDTRVLHEVRAFRREVAKRQENLNKARTAQAELVRQRADEKRAIQGRLGEQQRLLASVKDEIAKLQAEERKRQALLAAQARARYLAQLQEQRAQALQTAALAAQQQAQTAPPQELPGVSTPDLGLAPAPPARYGNVVGIAMQYLGVPYVWGGSSPSGGFDCSGFVTYVYAQVGVSLPHQAAAQYSYGVPVSRDELQPGDLVFFDGLGHVGIYIGGGQFVHAPHTGDVVKISSLADSWYASNWVGARRIL